MYKNNFFQNINYPLTGEVFTELLRCENIVIQRIVSSSQPDNIIYNQEEDEWVILLEGKATLEINNHLIVLNAGDYIFIPKFTPHKVVSTVAETVWLAIHIYPHHVT